MTRSGKVVDITEADKKVYDTAIKNCAKRGLRTLAICIK